VGRPRGAYNKDKPFQTALRRKLFANDGRKLGRLADAVINAGLKGNAFMIKEIADRIDGKVPRPLPHVVDDEFPLERLSRIEYVIVDPQLPAAKRITRVDDQKPEKAKTEEVETETSGIESVFPSPSPRKI
jgi:hypothetical protein